MSIFSSPFKSEKGVSGTPDQGVNDRAVGRRGRSLTFLVWSEILEYAFKRRRKKDL